MRWTIIKNRPGTGTSLLLQSSHGYFAHFCPQRRTFSKVKRNFNCHSIIFFSWDNFLVIYSKFNNFRTFYPSYSLLTSICSANIIEFALKHPQNQPPCKPPGACTNSPLQLKICHILHILPRTDFPEEPR